MCLKMLFHGDSFRLVQSAYAALSWDWNAGCLNEGHGCSTKSDAWAGVAGVSEVWSLSHFQSPFQHSVSSKIVSWLCKYILRKPHAPLCRRLHAWRAALANINVEKQQQPVVPMCD